MSKVIAEITIQERDTIQDIFEKKVALENLTKIVNPKENNEMYQRLLKDYSITVNEFQKWWDSMQEKYKWNAGNYYVDFENCQVCKSE